MKYREFKREVSGYTFHCKRTGKQIFIFEMFWARLKPKQCFEKYNTEIIKKNVFY